jgi:hypothetical protein
MREFGILVTSLGVICLFANNPDAGVFCTLIGVVVIAGSRGEGK